MQSRQGSGLRTQATLCREPSIVQFPLFLLHLFGPAQPGRQQGQTSTDRCLERDAHSVPGFTAGSAERLDQCCMFRAVARESAFWRHHAGSLGVSGHLCFLHKIGTDPCDTGHAWGPSQPFPCSLPLTFILSLKNEVVPRHPNKGVTNLRMWRNTSSAARAGAGSW